VSVVPKAGSSIDVTRQYKGRSMAQDAMRRLLKNRGAIVGMCFLVVLAAAALLSGHVFDYDRQIIGMDPTSLYAPPSAAHPFGCDNMGRDIFARVCYGARYSLLIGLGSVTIGLIIGIALGALAGFYGGVLDELVMRANDILYAVPNIMIAVVIVSILGTSPLSLLLSLCATAATAFTRIARAAVMQIRWQEFIESAYAIGLPTWKVILRHVIPNCLSPIIVQATLAVGTNIIAATSLSFLGVGVPVPLPEWGAMLADGRAYIRSAPWMCIFPGLAIMMTVLALNLMGDGLRDALDPKLKR
ncbi:MAG: ABC transporter permease, partial [Synergistaceae bacterium]|nr:ABC transporter permease [Synergistaceae bacterium]